MRLVAYLMAALTFLSGLATAIAVYAGIWSSGDTAGRLVATAFATGILTIILACVTAMMMDEAGI